MDLVISTIALNVLSNFLTDALRTKKGESSSALKDAIDSTCALHPEIEGLDETLSEWIHNGKVADELSKVIEGTAQKDELPIAELAQTFLDHTQFYLPSHSQPTATKIISTFITKIRAAYLKTQQFGMTHVANRIDRVDEHILGLHEALASSFGLRPALQTHLQEAETAFKSRDYPRAKPLFASLLLEVDRIPNPDIGLSRQIHVYLGKIEAALGFTKESARHYEEAARLDQNPVRAAVNLAVAQLLEEKYERALSTLQKVEPPKEGCAYEYWSAVASSLMGLEKFDEALEIAVDLHAAVAWVEKQARLIGLREPLTTEESKWIEAIGEAAVASIAVAKQRSLLLITDQLALAEIARQNGAVRGVHSQAVLMYLLSEKKLDVDTYNRATIKLIEAGYSFIRVDDVQLYSVIVQEQFQISVRLKQIFGTLESASIDLKSACLVAAGLIRKLYLEPLPDEIREPLLFFILDTVARNHPKFEVQRLIRTFLRMQMSHLLSPQYRLIERSLDRW